MATAFFLTLPFVVSFSGLDKFRLPKEIYAVVFIVLFAAAVLLRGTVTLPRRFDLWSWLLVAGVAYAALHSLLTANLGGLAGAARILGWGLLLALLTKVLDESFQKKIWLLAGFALSVNAVITVLQNLGKFPLMIRPSGEILGGRITPAGFIGDVNSGAFLFGLASLAALYWLVAESDRKVRIAAAAVLTLNLAGLAFTRTLTALIALTVSALLWLGFHHWWTLRIARKKPREMALFWAVLAIGLVAAAIAASQAGVLDRLQVVSRQMSRGNWSVATAGRQPVFLITWKMIQERPLLGRGLNTFGRDFFSYRAETEYGRGLPMVNQPGAFRQVHNEYLQVWEELGAVGLGLFLALLGLPVWRTARGAFQTGDPQKSYWRGILSIGGVYVAISCLTFFPFHLAVSSSYIVLWVACQRRAVDWDPETPTWAPGAKLPALLNKAWVKPVVVSAAVILLCVVQAGIWRANVDAGVAAFLLEQAQGSPPGRGVRLFADEALTRLKRAEERAPHIAEIYNLQGSAYMLLGRPEEAIERYARASRDLPSPEVYTNLAAACMAAGQVGRARPYLESALRYNPDYHPARQALDYVEKNAP